MQSVIREKAQEHQVRSREKGHQWEQQKQPPGLINPPPQEGRQTETHSQQQGRMDRLGGREPPLRGWGGVSECPQGDEIPKRG